MKRSLAQPIAYALAVVAWLTIAGTAAQTPPDFSGRWTSEPEAAPTRAGGAGGRGRVGDLGSGWGSPITITQDASKLTVEYMFFGRGDMQPAWRFVYTLDGSETKNSVMMGRGIQEQRSRTTWDNDKLVITTLYPFTNPVDGKPTTSEVKRTLSLESPVSLVIETRRAGVLGGPSSTTRTVFTKNQP
ncbi:MAG: hypothetical protein WEE89_09430 [Gemmatimonadota bacterium]